MVNLKDSEEKLVRLLNRSSSNSIMVNENVFDGCGGDEANQHEQHNGAFTIQSNTLETVTSPIEVGKFNSDCAAY